MPRRRLPGEVSGSSGSRSPARASPRRHGASPSSSTRRQSTQGIPRGRSGSRPSSDQVSEKQERPPRRTFSPAGSHQAPASRDRSHYGSPSQQASPVRSSASAPYGYTPTRLDTPVYTPTCHRLLKEDQERPALHPESLCRFIPTMLPHQLLRQVVLQLINWKYFCLFPTMSVRFL
jgi:hypothetical protein